MEGCSIDAIAQPGGRRPIGKDMSKMCIALGTAHFGAYHAVTAILQRSHGVRAYRCGKAGPATAGVELVLAGKQRRPAADTMVGAGTFFVQQRAGKGRLGAAFFTDVMLLRRQGLFHVNRFL